MAKKPHIDFALRGTLDGTEEIYSQNTLWEPAEQKFTVAQLASHILAQLPAGGESNTASNTGVGGLGVYDGKDGIDLQFRNLISVSDILTLNLNGNNIEFDIDPAQINPVMIFTDLQDVPVPGAADTMIFWDGASYDWTERGVPRSKNVGTAGVGVFDAKTGFEFDFRNIAPGSPKVQITLSGKNIEVDVDAGSIANDINFTDLNDIAAPVGDVILHFNGSTYDWIPTPSGGGATPDASNGLTLNTDYELGGTLSKNTSIDISTFDFDISRQAVSLKTSTSNPFSLGSNECFFLHTENATEDTENIAGVTDEDGSGGMVQLWSRKPVEGSYAYLFQTPGTTSLRSYQQLSNLRTEATFAYSGVFMDTYSGSNSVAAISMSQNVSEFKRINNGSTVNFRIQEKTTSSANLEVLLEGIPQFINVSAAQTLGYPSNGLFKNSSGALYIVP